MTEHTKTPWAFHINKDDGCIVYGINPDDMDEICYVSAGFDEGIDEANAAFIVKACNCYNDLVAALEGLQDAFIHTPGNTKGNKAKTDMIMYNQRDVPAALRPARYALDKVSG